MTLIRRLIKFLDLHGNGKLTSSESTFIYQKYKFNVSTWHTHIFAFKLLQNVSSGSQSLVVFAGTAYVSLD